MLGELVVPGRLILEHGVDDGEELAHDGDEGDFGRLARRTQALIEGAERGVVPCGDQRGHVEGGAYGCATAPDLTATPPLAAVAVEGGDADEGGDGAAVEAPQFGEVGEQGPRDRGTDAGDAAQEVFLDAPDRTLLNRATDLVINIRDAALEPADMVAQVAGHGSRRDMGEPQPLGVEHLQQLAPARHEEGEGLRVCIGECPWPGLHARAKERQHARVNRIGLAVRPSACANARTWRGLITATGPCATAHAATSASS